MDDQEVSHTAHADGAEGATSTLVVVTPARDEAVHLPALIECVSSQTRPPDRWVIVDDGSTDGTGDLARDRCRALPWVTVVGRDDDGGRSFGSKAAAVNGGAAVGITASTRIVVNLDADVRPPPHFLERVEAAFATDPGLGVFGGVYAHHSTAGLVREKGPSNHVPGGVQGFRREVWDAIGGYGRFTFGGEDTMASRRAEMLGWAVRHDPDLLCEHLRPTGTFGGTTMLRAQFRNGRQDRDLGIPGWFALLKVCRSLVYRPYVVGGLARGAGFVRQLPRRPAVTADETAFVRDRLRCRIARALPWARSRLR